jgi:ATP-dependent Clp protease ATP-binding subunit ClpA
MFERFDSTSRTVVVQAREEARVRASMKLEAEHILLALSRHPTSDAGRILAGAGLDHEGIDDALDRLVRQSLEAVGMKPGAVALAERPTPATRQPRWGTSAKASLRRTAAIARHHGDRSIRATHILLAVLQARVDTAALVAKVEATLGGSR